jgi:hypothetical protein
MRTHLLAIFIAVGAALFVYGVSGLKLDFKGDVLSGWNDQDRIAITLGAVMIIWAFTERRLN